MLLVATPGGAGARHLVDRDALRALGPEGYVFDVGRADAIAEALMNELRAKSIAGTALNVFFDEPDIPQAFREQENVTLTPHLGSVTALSRRRMAEDGPLHERVSAVRRPSTAYLPA